MKTLKENPSAANLTDIERQDLFDKQYQDKQYDKGLPHIQSSDRISSASTFMIGRSIQSSYKRAPQEDSKSVYGLGKETFQALKSVDRAFSAFP